MITNSLLAIMAFGWFVLALGVGGWLWVYRRDHRDTMTAIRREYASWFSPELDVHVTVLPMEEWLIRERQALRTLAARAGEER